MARSVSFSSTATRKSRGSALPVVAILHGVGQRRVDAAVGHVGDHVVRHAGRFGDAVDVACRSQGRKRVLRSEIGRRAWSRFQCRSSLIGVSLFGGAKYDEWLIPCFGLTSLRDQSGLGLLPEIERVGDSAVHDLVKSEILRWSLARVTCSEMPASNEQAPFHGDRYSVTLSGRTLKRRDPESPAKGLDIVSRDSSLACRRCGSAAANTLGMTVARSFQLERRVSAEEHSE